MLSIRDVSAGYAGQPVLSGVTLEARRGELVALIGPNGCGKTTLLRTVTGVLPLAGGTITLDGDDVRAVGPATLARRVAVVGQGATLPERFSAFEVALMGRTPHLRILQSEGKRDVDAVRAAMERADCWHLRDRLVEQMSGGERQRVLLARALAQEADLLLLDEPTSHLDIQHQVETFSLVLALCRAQRLCAVAVVHDLTLAATFADRVALMSAGRIVADGAPAEVLRPQTVAEVYGVSVRVLRHPVSGRPIVVPEAAAAAGEEVS